MKSMKKCLLKKQALLVSPYGEPVPPSASTRSLSYRRLQRIAASQQVAAIA